MATFTIKPAPAAAADDSLDQFLLELDTALRAPRSAPRAKTPTKVGPEAPPPFVQQWFPRALVEHMHTQECACGAEFPSFTGLFLEDMHRNGATRQQRHTTGLIPHEYAALPIKPHHTIEHIATCPSCQRYAFALPLDDAARELVRELSTDDRNSLKETRDGQV